MLNVENKNLNSPIEAFVSTYVIAFLGITFPEML
jgi:hypothetical protein